MAILNCGIHIPESGEQLPLCFDLKEASEMNRLGVPYAIASELPVTEDLYACIVGKLSKNKRLLNALKQITIKKVKSAWSNLFGETDNPFNFWPSWAKSAEMIVTPCIYRIERDIDFAEEVFCISVKLPLEANCFYFDHFSSGNLLRSQQVISSLLRGDKDLTVLHNEIHFHFLMELKKGEDNKYDLLQTVD